MRGQGAPRSAQVRDPHVEVVVRRPNVWPGEYDMGESLSDHARSTDVPGERERLHERVRPTGDPERIALLTKGERGTEVAEGLLDEGFELMLIAEPGDFKVTRWAGEKGVRVAHYRESLMAWLIYRLREFGCDNLVTCGEWGEVPALLRAGVFPSADR